MSGQQPDTFTKIILGVLSSLLVACVIGGVKMYADQQVLKRDLAQLAADKERDEKQDANDLKHWRYLAYLKTELDNLRHQHQLPPAPPPNLGD